MEASEGVDVQRRTSELKAENLAFTSEVRSLQRRLAEVRAQRQVSLGQLQRRPSSPPAGIAASVDPAAGPPAAGGGEAHGAEARRGGAHAASGLPVGPAAPARGAAAAAAPPSPPAGASGAEAHSGGAGSPGGGGGDGSPGGRGGAGSPGGHGGAGSPSGRGGAGSPGGRGFAAAGWRALEEDIRRGRAALRRSASSDGANFHASPLVTARRPARPSSAGSADASARRPLRAPARSTSSVELLRDENYFLTERLVEASVQHAQSFESFSNDRNTMWPLVHDLRRQVQDEQAQASQCKALLKSSQHELEALAEENLKLAERLTHRGPAGFTAAPKAAPLDAADPRGDARQKELLELQKELEAKDRECRQLREFAAQQAEQAEATIRDLAAYGAELQARLAEASGLLELHGLLPPGGGSSPAAAAAAAEAARAAAPRLAQELFVAHPLAAHRPPPHPPRPAPAPAPSLRGRASLIAPPAPRSPAAHRAHRPSGAQRHPPPPLSESEKLERSLQVKAAELDRLRRAAIAAVT